METAYDTDTYKYIKQWEPYLKAKSIETRNDIVLEYIDLVKKIVLRFRGSYNNFAGLDDMVNQGIIALIDAVEKFDPYMGNKFETFATLKVRGAIIDFMRKQDWIPRNQRNLVKELDEVYSELYAKQNAEPTQEEIAEKMGINIVQLNKIMEQRQNSMILSYEEMINEKMLIAMPLEKDSNHEGSPENALLFSEMKEKLAGAVDQLSEKERLVVSLYYYENLKLKEIARVLGITESRVSQIHSSCIMKLKNKLSSY